MSRNTHGRRRAAIALVAAGGTALSGVALLGPATSTASSHREAPLISNDPAADNTDLYAFVSPDAPDTVTFIANWAPLSEPTGGPTFYPFPEDTRYNIKIDNDGDAKADITYRWTFSTQDARGDVAYPPEDQPNDGTFLYNNGAVESLDDENLLFQQTYDLVAIDGEGVETPLVTGGKVAPSNTGAAGMPNYAALRDEAITTTLVEGGKSYVGQADDPFFLDLRVFDLLYGADLSLAGNDTLDGYNVNTVALQVPKTALAIGGDAENNPVIGVWSTTDRQSIRTQNADGTQAFSGDFVQVSRLGNPLVNEVVIPAQLKDAFNALAPENDASVPQAVARVLYPEVPKLVEAIYGIEAPAEPRNDLFEIFLTGLSDDGTEEDEVPVDLNAHSLNADSVAEPQPSEQLRLNMAIDPAAEPNRLGVLAGDIAGFPNGRRLADDVIDIVLQAAEGAVRTGEIVEPLAAGDGVNTNDVAFGSTFPYIALPNTDAVNSRNASSGGDGNGGGGGGGGETPAAGGSTGGNGGTTGGGTTGGGSTAPTGGAATGFGGAALSSSDSVPVLPLSAALAGIVLAGSGVVMLRRRVTS